MLSEVCRAQDAYSTLTIGEHIGRCDSSKDNNAVGAVTCFAIPVFLEWYTED